MSVRGLIGACRPSFRTRSRALTTALESFLVTSWAEHLRQHERLTRADSAIEQEVRSHAQEDPIVRHLIHAEAGD
jgi:hypothetical protein